GGTATAIHLDVTQKDAVEAVADRIAKEFSTIDIGVNSAGVAFRCAAEDFPEEMFDLVIQVNIKGTYLCCQSFGRKMLVHGKGSIINMGSIGSFKAYPLASPYLASKGGVLQMTRAFALEWIGRGVRVNAIAP